MDKFELREGPKAPIGRLVHFVQPNGAELPAMVVNDWPDIPNILNLLVFCDGPNGGAFNFRLSADGNHDLVKWVGSVPYSVAKEPYTWHWPER